MQTFRTTQYRQSGPHSIYSQDHTVERVRTTQYRKTARTKKYKHTARNPQYRVRTIQYIQ